MAGFSSAERCDPGPGRHCNSTIPRLYGFICNLTQGRRNYYNISDDRNGTTLIHCVDCFFPNHCLDNNTCLWGTAGPTCERCLRQGEQGNENSFYPLGSLCVECGSVPWSLIIFLCICIASVITVSRLGFSVSLYVKLRLLCNYLQLLLLTINVRILWPGIYLTALKFIASVNFVTELTSPECLFDPLINPYYFRWIFVLSIPVIAIALLLFFNRSMTAYIRDAVGERRQTLVSRRQQWQRFSIFLCLVSYSPLLVTAVHCKACSKNMYKNFVLAEEDVFMYDQGSDISCDQLAFQFFTSVCSMYLLLWLFVPYIVAFLTLRQQKWHRLTSRTDCFGSLYEPYTGRLCFWESVHLMRMMLMIIITEVFLFNRQIQLVVLICLTCGYVLAVCACRPYRKVSWVWSRAVCVHLAFEVLSNASLLLLQVSGYVMTNVQQDGYPVELSYVVLTLMAATLLYWTVMVCLMIKEAPIQQINEKYQREGRSESWRRSTSSSSHVSCRPSHNAQSNWEVGAGDHYSQRYDSRISADGRYFKCTPTGRTSTKY